MTCHLLHDPTDGGSIVNEGLSPRVLMVVPQYPYPVVGGLERQAHELAKALLNLKIGVQVVSGRQGPTQPAEDTVEGVLVHRIPWSGWKTWRFVRTPVDLFLVLYRWRATYDVVHLHQCSSFSLFGVVAAQWGGHFEPAR